jgi:hypothetical protein
MQLDESYRNAEQIIPEILREHNKNIYWNLIWYFADNHLPYDFMVPYAGDDWLQDLIKNSAPQVMVRNRVRMDQLLRQEGGLEQYIRLIEQRARKEHRIMLAEAEKTGSFKKGKKKTKKAISMSQTSGIINENFESKKQ